MAEANPRLDRFFARDTRWRAELQALRAIMLDGPVEEDLRWRQPCYRAHGGNIAIVGGMKDCAFVSFLKGALLGDPEGLLVPPGDNSRSARMLKFTSLAGIEAAAPAIRALVVEAVGNEAKGLKIAFQKDDLDWPPELQAVLDEDATLREAFETLTPGRRRGWLLHVSQPKQSKTVVARIEKAAGKIMDGKGMHD
ncbi:MAG: YdeI/OmpD-associated family protein [Paracoccus sp. (in: a-proteobacteria)]